MQSAIFVDAGYLYAQGSALLAGHKQPRTQIALDIEKALDHLKAFARQRAEGERLLRIYWYDGLQRSGRLSSEQEQVAGAFPVKLRLGVVNSNGDQKGVDSLIVTDLIELARNRAITSAVLVSGDEDIRVGVQIAQTFGVQVHLLGIRPARGSQSPDLIREADSHGEWDETVLSAMMSVRDLDVPPPAAAVTIADAPSSFLSHVGECIADTLETLDPAVIAAARRAFKANPTNVPPELDRPTLGKLKKRLARELLDEERKAYRQAFRTILSRA